jgi:phenylacetate-CoA ligase
MLVLADEMEAQGLDPREIKLRCGIFGAEPWTNKMRDEMEARLGIDCLDIYGLSEVIGPGVAQECLETKDGPTIWEDHFYPEIVDKELNPIADGEMGELVFTSLTKEAMPVFRYRTKDLTRLLPGTARTMRRFDKITGRSDDMMIIRGVNVFPSQIEEQVLRDERLSPHYHLILSREGHLDKLAVQVERREAGQAKDEEIKKNLAHHIKSFIGISTKIEVLEPGAIPRSQGKAVRVTDNRPKE